MSEQFIIIKRDELKELIKSSVTEALSQKPQQVLEPAPVVYRTRKYVMELLHTSAPTLDKYTKSGLLKVKYFGRRPLYDDASLNLVLPQVQSMIKRKQSA